MATSETLNGRVAIVTGAGRGMGRAVAIAIGERGGRVVVNDLDSTSAEETAAKLTGKGCDAIAVQADVVDPSGGRRMVDRTVERFGAVHILVNNAGILRPTSVPDISVEEWELVIGVNLKGTFLCSQAVLPSMKDGGWGRIVNFSSTAGKSVSTLGGAHYTAAKAGILGFTRHLAKEVAGDGITVNAVCPGLIDTEMVRSTIDKERIQRYTEGFPISRLGKPEEVADLVAFLASDRAAYITGAAIDINGGDLMV